MRKVLVSLGLLFTIWCMFGSSQTVFAAQVDDQANLFDEATRTDLETQLSTLEAKVKAHFFIVTNDDNQVDPQKAADYILLDHLGKDANGLVLMIDMNQRRYVISTSGNMIDYFTDKRIEQTLDDMEDYMIEGNYGMAASTFVANTGEFIEVGIPHRQYRIDSETGKITYYKALTAFEVLLSVVAALVVSGLFCLLVRAKYMLKFKWSSHKYNYQEHSTFHLSEKNDHLINSFVTTRHIPRNNHHGGGGGGGGSTTHSTGGGTFGGGSRGF